MHTLTKYEKNIQCVCFFKIQKVNPGKIEKNMYSFTIQRGSWLYKALKNVQAMFKIYLL